MTYIMTEEHKAKIAAANKGQKRPNISAAKKGKKHSEQAKANIAAALKGKKRPEQVKANISKANLISEKFQEWVHGERECPYCNKIGSGPIMDRWHFERCTSFH